MNTQILRRLSNVFVLVIAAQAAEVSQPLVQRSVHIDYTAAIKPIPAGIKKLDLWLPVPHSDSYQDVGDVAVVSPVPYHVAAGSEGNQILHIQLDNPPQTGVELTLSFNATRREHRGNQFLNPSASTTADESATDLAKWLKPDRLVPLDPQIHTWATEVVDAANAKTDLEKARAIYNHVVATVKYDKTGNGWGRGDIYYACEARRGNCTDFHAIFIGYARSLGIPARFAIGLPLPAERTEGKIAGYHCWAEFYATGIGWVPIDASEAAKNPAKREYFFGTHDENRVEFSKGRDLILTPRQTGEPLNYFIYPYAELDGAPASNVISSIAYKELAGGH